MAETPPANSQNRDTETETFKNELELLSARTKLEQAKLANIHAISARWATTVGSLVSVSGVFLLVQERDAITGLTMSRQVIVAVLLGAALVGALVTTMTTVLLARDEPAPSSNTSNGLVRRILAWFGNRESLMWLKRHSPWHWLPSNLLGASMKAAILTIALLFLATMVVWFGERKGADEQSYWVHHSDGSISCGTLVKDHDGKLGLAGRGVTIALTDVAEISEVNGCP
jgi:hypothetical protein